MFWLSTLGVPELGTTIAPFSLTPTTKEVAPGLSVVSLESVSLAKVPTLLNVERTAPYFHDGAVKTLPDAVKKMADIQLDMNLSEKQVEEIVAFLESLNGELPKIEKPTLPPSGPETRKYIEEVY